MKYRMNVRHFLVKYVEFVKSEKKNHFKSLHTIALEIFVISFFVSCVFFVQIENIHNINTFDYSPLCKYTDRIHIDII